MRFTGLSILLLSSLLGGCSGEADLPVDAPLADPESSEVILQAVDAGTGAALADSRMTVRYLVRAPITLDATATEQVVSSEPYRIAHAVAEDQLVLEVRLEAPSYHRLDTVLAVARGSSAGPFTIRMARRLDRAAGARPSRPSQSGPTRPEPRPTDPDAGIDRSALRAGDRAFRNGDWAAATSAYGRLDPPPRRSGTYAGEYAQALVNWGVSHMNLGEWASALGTLEEALGYDASGPPAYLLLTQAQCAVGRTDEGRRTLGELATIPGGDRPPVLALIAYQHAMCSQYEFGQAQSAIEVVRTGGRAIQEFNGFIELGEALSPAPTDVDTALTDARRRVEEIRERMRQLRG